MPLNNIVHFSPGAAFLRTEGNKGYSNASANWGVASSQTILAWVRPTVLPAVGLASDIARLFTDDTKDQVALSLVNSGGQGFFRYQTSNSLGTVTLTMTGITPVRLGDWYCVVGCKNDTATQRLFVNGQDDVTPVLAGIPVTANLSRSSSFAFDNRPVPVNSFFDGDLHSIALWDVALSEGTIRALYSGGWKDVDLRDANHPSYGEALQLKHWLRFGQGAVSGISTGSDVVADWVSSGGIALTSVGNTDVSSRTTTSTSPTGRSTLFDNSSGISSTPALPIGIANQWSIAMWLNPGDVSINDQNLLYIGPASPSETNAINMDILGAVANNPFQVEVRDSAGAVIKRIKYDGLLTANVWQHLLITFDGAVFDSIEVYKNGRLQEGSVDISGGTSQVDSSRFLEVGGSTQGVSSNLLYEGKIGHMGIWSTTLNQDEASYVASQGYSLDLRFNSGDYSSAEFLKHYYKWGEDVSSKARDFLDTQTGAGVLPLTVETGSIEVVGDSPSSIITTSPVIVGISLATTPPDLTGGVPGSTIVIPVPPGVQEGDLLIAVARDTGFVGVAPAGWSLAAPGEDTTIDFHEATASEPASYTWTGIISGRSRGGCMIAIRGGVIGDAKGSSDTLNLPSVTVIDPNAMLLAISGVITDMLTHGFSPNGNLIERAQHVAEGSTTPGLYVNTIIASESNVGAGTKSGRSFSLSSTIVGSEQGTLIVVEPA